MKESFVKVKFNFGNNDKYHYYIIDEKSKAKDTEIEADSIAYKIGGPGTYKVSKYAQLSFGNYDYVLEIRNKGTDDFRGLTLASEDEIERI
jgi:hypothetical protein